MKGKTRRRPGDFAGPVYGQREVALVNKLEESGRYAFLVPECEPEEVGPLTLADLLSEPDEVDASPLRFGQNVSVEACFGRRRWRKG